MRGASVLVILFGLFASIPAWAQLSGTYIGKAHGLAVLVQIVETAGGNLTGRYQEVVLKPDGRIDETNATMSGARNGETVVATLRTAVIPLTIPMSGTYRGGILHLTTGTTFALDLSNGDEAGFRAEVAALQREAGQIIDARKQAEAAKKQAAMEADRLKRTQSITGRLNAFNTKADMILPKFGAEAQKYRSITERMRIGLAKQKTLVNGVQRGQMSVAINQLAIEANQVNIDHQGAYQDFDFNAAQVGREAAEVQAWCSSTVPAYLVRACPAFLDAHATFTSKVYSLRAAFADLGATWTAERREQQALLEASGRMQ